MIESMMIYHWTWMFNELIAAFYTLEKQVIEADCHFALFQSALLKQLWHLTSESCTSLGSHRISLCTLASRKRTSYPHVLM
jgi:hypothetical protein